MSERGLILIIGACGNIGKSILLHEISKGKKIISIDIKKLDLEFSHKNIKHYTLDLTLSEEINVLSDVLKENNTKISSVVLASALDSVPLNEKGNQESYTKGIQFAGLEDLRKRIDVNITSQLFIIKSIYKYLDINSHILLFSSIYGVRSPDHRIYQKNFIKPLEYTTSKSAIIGLTKHLSVTLALEKKGRANCLILGGLRNETQDENFQANYIDKVPLKRMLEKEDILNIYDFLNSDKSSYITGSSIAVDGGYTAW